MTKVKAVIAKKSYSFDCPEHMTILDAALDEGIPAPFSCMSGSCSTCIAKVIRGSFSAGDQSFLETQQKEQGLILTCQAKPLGPDLELEFVEE